MKFLEVCTGNFQESDGTERAPPGTKCKSDCIISTGRWGYSYCYTEDDHSQWGAECTQCK